MYLALKATKVNHCGKAFILLKGIVKQPIRLEDLSTKLRAEASILIKKKLLTLRNGFLFLTPKIGKDLPDLFKTINNNMKIIDIDIEELLPHEQVRPLSLIRMVPHLIIRNIPPIIVDKDTKTIIDGHHRVTISKIVGLKEIPAFVVNYVKGDHVAVLSRRNNFYVNKLYVVNAALSGNLFPPKTTKHVLTEHLVKHVCNLLDER